MDEVKQMYLANDFEEMIELGVNTVQIPVPLGLFVEGGERLETLTHLMNHVDKVIPNPKNTGRGTIPTFFGYQHIQLCGASLSTEWGACEADISIWHATPKT
jgi:hypothetical protein